VQNRRGDASPGGGFSTGEANSRIDDYFNQDEQINVNPDSGVVKVLRVNQKNLINDFVTAVFPLNTRAPARESATSSAPSARKEGGRAEVIQDKVQKKYWLQVICPAFMLPHIEEAVRQLDQAWIKEVADGSVDRRVPREVPADRDVRRHRVVLRRRRRDLHRHERQPAVLRRDEPYRVEKYIAACEELDQPPPQAHLKVRIYEVDTSNDLKLGVDWIAWKNGPGRSLFQAIFSGQDSYTRYRNATGFFDPNLGTTTVINPGTHSITNDSSQYLLSANYVLTTAYLDFLRVKGKARSLAEPEIFVRNARTATWSSTTQFLSFAVAPSDPGPFGTKPALLDKNPAGGSIADQNFTHNRTLKHRLGSTTATNQVGLSLTVTPVVGMESAEVQFTFSSTELSGTTPQGTPIISTRTITSKQRLVDGQPFVFGGLTRTEDVRANNKAPWLGDIPGLGYLFGQETTSARRKEMIITVLPKLIQGCHEKVADPGHLETMAKANGEQSFDPPESCWGFDKMIFDTVEHPSDDGTVRDPTLVR
jgi:type II secretory pathway component GspD/PulD (secretin)